MRVGLDQSVRILNWNIRHGGGSRRGRILGRVADFDADVIVLTEYRNAPEFLDRLRAIGYTEIAEPSLQPRMNGVLVASRLAMQAVAGDSTPAKPPGRWTEVIFPDLTLRLGASYLPGATSGGGAGGKRDHWIGVTQWASARKGEKAVLVGDLNTGAHWLDEDRATFHCADAFCELEAVHGWRDAWRLKNGQRREFTWWSRARGGALLNGYRLDHIFLSPPLAPTLRDCWYSQSEREEGLSDHAVQVADIDLGESGKRRTGVGAQLAQIAEDGVRDVDPVGARSAQGSIRR